jgi:hypothetical protein
MAAFRFRDVGIRGNERSPAQLPMESWDTYADELGISQERIQVGRELCKRA